MLRTREGQREIEKDRAMVRRTRQIRSEGVGRRDVRGAGKWTRRHATVEPLCAVPRHKQTH